MEGHWVTSLLCAFGDVHAIILGQPLKPCRQGWTLGPTLVVVRAGLRGTDAGR